MDARSINWGSLKVLKLQGNYHFMNANCIDDSIEISCPNLEELTFKSSRLPDKVLQQVVSSCPLLRKLELDRSYSEKLVIASKSLKILVLRNLYRRFAIEISCPNLEELTFKSSLLPDKVLQHVESSCPMLRKLELDGTDSEKLVIASKSLKKLVLSNLNKSCAVVISCPNLEELNCYGKHFGTFELMKTPCKLKLGGTDSGKLVIVSKSLKKLVLSNLDESCAIVISCPNLEELNCYGKHFGRFELMNTPCLIYAALDFEISQYGGCLEDKAKQIFEQLQNVKDLTFKRCFIKIILDAGIGGQSYLWVNNKVLTLKDPNFELQTQIVCALRSSPMLERLVIKLWVYRH